MRVNRWLTVLPFLFLLQISFCGQQDLDTALLTIEVLDDQGEDLSGALILLNGEELESPPPLTLELDPWVGFEFELIPPEGWLFLNTSRTIILEPSADESLVFQGNSLTGILNLSAFSVWGEALSGAEVLVDGVPQGLFVPASIELPADQDLEISLHQSDWAFSPIVTTINLEPDAVESSDFEGMSTLHSVLAEDFSNISCNGCPEAEAAMLSAVSQASGEVIPLSFHLSWPAPADPIYRYAQEVNEERWIYYGGYSFVILPTVNVDGNPHGNPDAQDSQILLEDMESRLELPSKIALRVASELVGDDVIVTADGKMFSDPTAGAMRIYYGLAEAEFELEESGSNGQTLFHNVVRHMNGVDGEYDGDDNQPLDGDPPVSIGEVFDVNVGEFFTFSTMFTPDAGSEPGQVNLDHLFAFVFVQAEGSREVLDAAQETHGGP